MGIGTSYANLPGVLVYEGSWPAPNCVKWHLNCPWYLNWKASGNTSNMSVLQSHLQVPCIYVHTTGFLLNFNVCKSGIYPEEIQNASDWKNTTLEMPSSLSSLNNHVAQSKAFLMYLVNSLWLCLYSKRSTRKWKSVPTAYGVVLSLCSELFWSFPQESQMPF